MNKLTIPNRRIASIQNTPRACRQRGAALMIALVMIIMVSIMGVSAMRGSTLEKRMAINAVQTSTTFQAAESAADLTLNIPNHLTIAHNAAGKEVVLPIPEVRSDSGLVSRSTLDYIGKRAAEGFSLGEGSNNFDSLMFIAQGVSAIPNVRSQSTVEQGAYRIVPGDM